MNALAIYRLAGADDLAELAEMRWDFRMEESEGVAANDKTTFLRACIAFLQRGLTTGTWAYWIAVVDGQIVSHIYVCKMQKVPKPNKLDDADGYVTNVYTRRAYRSLGIGSELMAHVKAWAKEQDYNQLFVWPSEASVPFYGRAGFVGHSDVMEFEVRPYVG